MQTVDSSGVNLLFLAAQTVKRLSTMRETRVRSLDWEDPFLLFCSVQAITKIPQLGGLKNKHLLLTVLEAD